MYTDNLKAHHLVRLYALRSNEVYEEILTMSDEEIESNYPEVVELVEEKKAALAKKKALSYSLKAENRAAYLPQPILVCNGDAEKSRWRYDRRLEPAGLLPQWEAGLHGAPMASPVLTILNEMDNDNDNRQHEVPTHYWSEFNRNGYVVSNRRCGWKTNSATWQQVSNLFPSAIEAKAYMHSLKAPLVPNGYVGSVPVEYVNVKGQKARSLTEQEVLDFLYDNVTLEDVSECMRRQNPWVVKAANNNIWSPMSAEEIFDRIHRRDAQLVEDELKYITWLSQVEPSDELDELVLDLEYLAYEQSQMPSTYSELCKEIGYKVALDLIKLAYSCLADVDVVNQGRDGSGNYHPSHPAMQKLVEKYGPVPMQIRGFDPESKTFIKGILVPSMQATKKVTVQREVREELQEDGSWKVVEVLSEVQL